MGDTRRYVALDGLRGVAASAVLLRHLGEQFALPGLARHGYLAVDLFFVISGFFMGAAYEARLERGEMSAGDFLRTRAVRLYPLIILGAALGGLGLIGRLPPHVVAEAAVLAMAALPLPLNGALFLGNIPLWSMFYEGVSNIGYVLLRPLLVPRVLAALMVLGAAGVLLVALRAGDLDLGANATPWWAGAARLTWPFLAGLALSRLERAGVKAAPALPLSLLAAALLVLLFLPQHRGGAFTTLDATGSLVVMPAVLWLGLSARAGPRQTRLCTIAGELSYPLYVLHYPIQGSVAGTVAHGPVGVRLAAAGLCLGLTAALALVAFRWYDRPVRRWLGGGGCIRQAPLRRTPEPCKARDGLSP